MTNPLLRLAHIRHGYGEQMVVDDLSLTLDKGEIGCLLGPSGCGKTTVLRCIAGFESLLSGEIVLNGCDVSGAAGTVPPEQRRIGMVFQDYALFPHLTVTANIAAGLHQMRKPDRQSRINELLHIVGLQDVAKKYPHQISGGQQQRVALARALAPRPILLLLDEPFSNLDVSLRERLGLEIRELLFDQQITALLVTHDQREAFAMADKIGVMDKGAIQQCDTAYNLYHYPVNRFVANFVGQGVLLPGKVLNSGDIETCLGVLSGNSLKQDVQRSERFIEGNQVDILLRPEDVCRDDTSLVQASITRKTFRGAEILFTLRLMNGDTIFFLDSNGHSLEIGEMIGIKLNVDHIVAFGRHA